MRRAANPARRAVRPDWRRPLGGAGAGAGAVNCTPAGSPLRQLFQPALRSPGEQFGHAGHPVERFNGQVYPSGGVPALIHQAQPAARCFPPYQAGRPIRPGFAARSRMIRRTRTFGRACEPGRWGGGRHLCIDQPVRVAAIKACDTPSGIGGFLSPRHQTRARVNMRLSEVALVGAVRYAWKLHVNLGRCGAIWHAVTRKPARRALNAGAGGCRGVAGRLRAVI